MRLLSLELEKYGAFTGRVLRFRPGARAHVVFGPNEAGKSTALMAVTDLLFGIPRDTTQDFLHKSPELRIRGEVISSKGQTFAFARRKGNKSTLLGPEGTALADDALAPYFGGLTRDVFTRAFGLNAQALRSGAEELLRSRGDVGESLMAAASGMRGLSELRKALDTEADRIFAPRKSVERAFYQAMDRHDAARKAMRERELRATDWKRLNEELAARAKRLDEIKAERADIATRQARLARLIRLKPRLGAIDAAAQALADHGERPEFPIGFGRRLGAALEAVANAETTQGAAAREVEAARLELSKILVKRDLLAHGAEIRASHSELGEYRKAGVDRPRVQAGADALQSEAALLAASLGFADVVDLSARQPTAAALAEIAVLIRDGQALEAKRLQIEQALAADANALARLEQRSATRGTLIDPAPLREKLAAFGDIASLVRDREREAGLIAAEMRALVDECKRLSPPIVDLETLATATLPDPRAIEAFRGDFDTRDEAIREKRLELAAAAKETERLSGLLRDLSGDHPIPSSDRVAGARSGRDAEWVGLRAALFGESGAPTGAALASSIVRFEMASGEADRIADEAARDAERVSTYKAAIADLARHRVRLDDAQASLDALLTEHDRDLQRWRDAWSPIVPSLPREMVGWLAVARGLLTRHSKVAAATAALGRLERDLAGLTPGLELLAAEAGLPPVAGLDAGRISTRVNERLKALFESWDAARDEATRKTDARARIAALHRENESLAPKIDAWTRRWRETTPSIGLTGDASREAASAALECWRVAPRVLKDLAEERRRVAGMTRDMEKFENDAVALVESLAPNLARLQPADAIEALNDLLDTARRDDVRHAEQTKRAAEREATLARATIDLEGARSALAALADSIPAGVDLAGFARLIDQRDLACETLQGARADFRLVSDNLDEAATRGDLEGFDTDRASAEAEALRHEDEDLDVERNGVVAAQHDLRRQIDDLEKGVGAEVAVQQLRNADVELRQLARDWAALRIGGLLIETALERQRADRKDPLLARAGDLFATLTGGGFSGVEQQFDEADVARLFARRGGDAIVPVAGLSEGARDQLFLALRLAYVEDYAERSEPAPFIADDLFTSFDDARTGFAMEALGALGARVQPIVFTHHRHVVEIARRALGADVDVIELA